MYGWNSYYSNQQPPKTPAHQAQPALLTPITPGPNNIAPAAFANVPGSSFPFVIGGYLYGASQNHHDYSQNHHDSSLIHHDSLNNQTTIANKSTSPKSVNYPVHRVNNVPLEFYDQLNKLYLMIQLKKYATSAIDPVRNYLTVYEYSINNQWIIWDYETGFVHLTGLWKAADGNSNSHRSKADIVKLLDSTPKQYHSYIKRIRGGFLKIQGTWLPYSLCKILARRFCYHIRYQLIPIFGNDFPNYCLPPNDPRFGELKFDDTEIQMADKKRKRDKRFDVMEASKCLHSLKSPTNDSCAKSYFEIPRQPLYKLEQYDSSLDKSYFTSQPLQSPPQLLSPVSFTHRRSGSDCSQYGTVTAPATATTTTLAPNYIATSSNNSDSDGIKSLLLAAEVTDKPDISRSPKMRRVSIKINDLLS